MRAPRHGLRTLSLRACRSRVSKSQQPPSRRRRPVPEAFNMYATAVLRALDSDRHFITYKSSVFLSGGLREAHTKHVFIRRGLSLVRRHVLIFPSITPMPYKMYKLSTSEALPLERRPDETHHDAGRLPGFAFFEPFLPSEQHLPLTLHFQLSSLLI